MLKSNKIAVRVDLGDAPPKLLQVRAAPRRIESTNQTHLDFFVELEANLQDSEIALTLGNVTISIKDLLAKGNLIVTLNHLCEEPPFFWGITMYFSTPPAVQFKFGRGLQLLHTVNLYSIVEPALIKGISDVMVLPQRKAVGIDRRAPVTEIRGPNPSGILTVDVLRATGLRGDDWNFFKALMHGEWSSRTSDPFVKLTIGNRSFQV